jgi:hypothetical protein
LLTIHPLVRHAMRMRVMSGGRRYGRMSVLSSRRRRAVSAMADVYLVF